MTTFSGYTIYEVTKKKKKDRGGGGHAIVKQEVQSWDPGDIKAREWKKTGKRGRGPVRKTTKH